MNEKLFRFVCGIVGLVIGYNSIAAGLEQLFSAQESLEPLIGWAGILGGLLGLCIGVLLAPAIYGVWQRTVVGVTSALQNTPITDMVAGVIGLVLGLLIVILATMPFPAGLVISYIRLFVVLFGGYAGAYTAVKKKDELLGMLGLDPENRSKDSHLSGANGDTTSYKILDTSVIIDGRIADISKTGFLEGTLIIPQFVLEELQHIADSPDSLKRNRGRRGLDILNKIQKESVIPIEIVDQDYPDGQDVDSKLVRLAKEYNGTVLTNDYNLNKVAELQGVPVLNINELANAVKPVVLPGEEMLVQVIKDGKEQGQGVAYLDDGTMIVVDSGKKHIGQEIEVMVTSVLQTAAGRMIFARPKVMEKAL
ncbi:MAG TPA: TRAM domain-containing protein [Firmicutes bacterium]|nr:TRAM domain-containing protein [Bacillota bacterium]